MSARLIPSNESGILPFLVAISVPPSCGVQPQLGGYSMGFCMVNVAPRSMIVKR